MPLYFISSRITEFGNTFTNAKCTILDIARVLNTLIVPAIDTFHILQSLKGFSIFKTRFIIFIGFRNICHMSNRLLEF